MSEFRFSIQGNIIDVVRGRIFPGTIEVNNGKILSVKEESVSSSEYILPGLVDAHIHIESSMLIPSEFARLAVTHGTVATVSDPHEIANVLGIEGIRFMIGNGKKVPFKFYFGASSCVPATHFETAGASIGVNEIDELLQMDEIGYLSEMMNFPGVIMEDEQVMAKIALAKKYGKPVDGHAPGLTGDDIRKYISAGISTDHECFTLEEATERASLGMKILIREGSAARNFEALAPLLSSHPELVMFCSDDRHPDDLAQRHINDIARRAILKGYDLLAVIKACTLNPKRHYNLATGLLQPGDPADLVVIDSPVSFKVLKTFINGELVSVNGKGLVKRIIEKPVNFFNARKISPDELKVKPEGNRIRVIEALEGQLITHELQERSLFEKDNVFSDPTQDILKIAVLNRYSPSIPAVAFIKNFGLKRGAMASTVAHDSHNIIAVGVSDEDIARAVNKLVDARGGICCIDGTDELILPLPVAGLMSVDYGYDVASAYEKLNKMAHDLGSTLAAPFMTLSFMALLVIPELKLSDKGLFDGKTFSFASLFLD
jgi:adenine deaminase